MNVQITTLNEYYFISKKQIDKANIPESTKKAVHKLLLDAFSDGIVFQRDGEINHEIKN